MNLVNITRVFAQGVVEYPINTNLPTSNGSTIDPAAGIAGMIGSIYTYLLSIAGAIAFLSIVYAGMQWALSQGNPSKISDAKDRIWQAFYGIALLFGAYLILAMVNPSLTFLKMPTLKPIQMPEISESGGGGGSGVLANPNNFVLGNQDANMKRLGACYPGETQAPDGGACKIMVNARPPKTLIGGLREDTLNYIASTKNSCNCNLIVTGGNEVDGHNPGSVSAVSHMNGYKVDFGLNDALNNYVTKNFVPAGVRDSDKAPLWRDEKTGAIWARESNHWDVAIP